MNKKKKRTKYEFYPVEISAPMNVFNFINRVFSDKMKKSQYMIVENEKDALVIKFDCFPRVIRFKHGMAYYRTGDWTIEEHYKTEPMIQKMLWENSKNEREVNEKKNGRTHGRKSKRAFR